MPELTEFLLARVADDEAVASLSKWPYGKDGPGGESPPWPTARQWSRELNSDDGPILGMSSPDRWLAECAAKRAIVALHVGASRGMPNGQYDPACSVDSYGLASPDDCETLGHLAMPYADHPEYDEAWRPSPDRL